MIKKLRDCKKMLNCEIGSAVIGEQKFVKKKKGDEYNKDQIKNNFCSDFISSIQSLKFFLPVTFRSNIC